MAVMRSAAAPKSAPSMPMRGAVPQHAPRGKTGVAMRLFVVRRSSRKRWIFSGVASGEHGALGAVNSSGAFGNRLAYSARR